MVLIWECVKKENTSSLMRICVYSLKYPPLSSITVCPILFVLCCCHVLFVSNLPPGHMSHSRWDMVVKTLQKMPDISVKIGLLHIKRKLETIPTDSIKRQYFKYYFKGNIYRDEHDRGNSE